MDNNSGTFRYGNNAPSPFTGAHEGLVDPTEVFEEGDIVVDVQVLAKSSVSDTITKVTKSTAVNQKSVVGVYNKHDYEDWIPTSMVDLTTDNSGNLNNTSYFIKPEYAEVRSQHLPILFNSIGEGQINVCGENGDIEIGDLITTSSIPGKGMKQADDLVRNYTVAKAREAVTFSSPTEVKMIACTYHCG